MTAKLVNFTAKWPGRLSDCVNPPELLTHPFCRGVSRTRYDAGLFRYAYLAESVEELARLAPSKLDWEECSLARARELLNLNRDRYYLSYSGGIDSTSMLIAFLRASTKEERAKFVIYMSGHSIQENPFFFENHVVQFPLQSSMAEISDRLIEENAILVTGECGDQLFGSDMLGDASAAFGDGIISQPFRDATVRIFGLATDTPEQAAALFTHFEPIAAECPFPVRTAHDFFWWFNFTQKWQHVKYRFLTHTSWNLAARYGKHIAAFYDSRAFQQWSLTNHDQKIGKTWQSYKFTVKEFIYRYTRDPGQRLLRKQQSLEKTFLVNECRLGVTDAWREIQTDDELRGYVKKTS